MKKLLLVMLTLFAVVTLSACSDVCIGTSCITEEPTENPGETPDECEDPGTGTEQPTLDGILFYDHINGHGDVVEDHVAYLLFEEEMQGFVKYQVAYLSCTCRPADVNFWQVMYIEVNKFTDDVKVISFTQDDPSSSHPYTAGLWGDSSPTPTGKTTEDFHNEFIPWLLGKTIEDFDGISVFTNDDYHGIQNTTTIAETDLIDSFAGSSVSTNNMIRIVKTILEYHEEEYGR